MSFQSPHQSSGLTLGQPSEALGHLIRHSPRLSAVLLRGSGSNQRQVAHFKVSIMAPHGLHIARIGINTERAQNLTRLPFGYRGLIRVAFRVFRKLIGILLVENLHTGPQSSASASVSSPMSGGRAFHTNSLL